MKSNPASATISTVSTAGIFMNVPMGGTLRPGSPSRSLSHVMSRGSRRLVDRRHAVVLGRGQDVGVGGPERVARLVLVFPLRAYVGQARQRRVDRGAVAAPGLGHGG